jgi:hypothetical protein
MEIGDNVKSHLRLRKLNRQLRAHMDKSMLEQVKWDLRSVREQMVAFHDSVSDAVRETVRQGTVRRG